MIGILDYGMGNISSVKNSLSYLGFDSKVVTSPDEFDDLSHLIFPGVGSFRKAMANLRERNLVQGIHKFVETEKPFLGICLGMQLLAEVGYEDGNTEGLGLVPGSVVPFEISAHVPHVGWNNIKCTVKHPVLKAQNHVDFYFVHSYYFQAKHESNILSTTNYEIDFCSAVQNKNVIGVQFHPEKSQEPGLNLLEAFCEWDGSC